METQETKNNTLWFKRKRYGWGWTPSSWQGWLTITIYIGLVMLNFNRINSVSHSGSDTLINFVPETLMLTIILFGICYAKGETPKWQWSEKDNDSDKK